MLALKLDVPVYLAGGSVLDVVVGFPLHRGILAGRRAAAGARRQRQPRTMGGILLRNAAALGVLNCIDHKAACGGGEIGLLERPCSVLP